MRMLLFVAGVSAMSATAAAQVLQPPTRSTDGQFDRRVNESERPQSTLVLNLDALGGRDDNGGGGGIVPSAPLLDGYFGTVSSSIRFGRGTNRQSFGFGARGYYNQYQSGVTQRGGEVSLDGLVSLGRRNQWTGNFGIANEPAFLVGSRGALADGSDVVDQIGVVDPGGTSGITSSRNRMVSVSTTVQRSWTARQVTQASLGASDAVPTGDIGFSNRDYDAGVRHSWNVSRSFALLGVYQYSEEQAQDIGGTANRQLLRSHTGSAGVTITRRLSPRRTLAIDLTGGISRLETLSIETGDPIELSAPAASAVMRMDLARSWALSSEFRREVTLLTGLSPQPFQTDTLFVNLGGGTGRRLSVAAAGSYARGTARDGTGAFSSTSGMIQSQVVFTQRWTALASYTYYRHNIRQVLGLPEGFPTRFDLNSVRVGLSLRFPLIRPPQSRG